MHGNTKYNTQRKEKQTETKQKNKQYLKKKRQTIIF